MGRQPTFGYTCVAYPLWQICQKFHRRYVELDDELEKRLHPSSPADYKAQLDIINERMETATIAIVFSATFLDQFIYLYGCVHFGVEECEKEFDRFTLRAKWLKISQRVFGKSIPENSAAIEMLNELVQVRHRIVHYKIFDMSTDVIPSTEKSQSLAKLTHKCARNSVATAKALMVELGKIDEGKTFQKFLTDFIAK